MRPSFMRTSECIKPIMKQFFILMCYKLENIIKHGSPTTTIFTVGIELSPNSLSKSDFSKMEDELLL